MRNGSVPKTVAKNIKWSFGKPVSNVLYFTYPKIPEMPMPWYGVERTAFTFKLWVGLGADIIIINRSPGVLLDNNVPRRIFARRLIICKASQ